MVPQGGWRWKYQSPAVVQRSQRALLAPGLVLFLSPKLFGMPLQGRAHEIVDLGVGFRVDEQVAADLAEEFVQLGDERVEDGLELLGRGVSEMGATRVAAVAGKARHEHRHGVPP